MNNSSLIHVIPVDDNNDYELQVISNDCKSRNLSSSVVRNDLNEIYVVDEAIQMIQKSRQTFVSAASIAIKREAFLVNKRLTAYQKRVEKRQCDQKLFQKRLFSASSAQKSYSLPLSPSTPKLVFHLNPSFKSNDKVSDDPKDKSHVASETITDNKSNKFFQNIQGNQTTDQQEQMMIWRQAYRMKRMSMLLCNIDSTYKKLLKELMEYQREWS